MKIRKKTKWYQQPATYINFLGFNIFRFHQVWIFDLNNTFGTFIFLGISYSM